MTATRRTIRSLKPGEPVPAGTPGRYKNSEGYVRLRWNLGNGESVECYEHRFVAGCLDPDLQVHHINGVRDDNRPENLEVIAPGEHQRRRHGARFDVNEAKRMYESGMSTPEIGRELGVDHSNVYRRLRSAGVRLRNLSESRRNLLNREAAR